MKLDTVSIIFIIIIIFFGGFTIGAKTVGWLTTSEYLEKGVIIRDNGVLRVPTVEEFIEMHGEPEEVKPICELKPVPMPKPKVL